MLKRLMHMRVRMRRRGALCPGVPVLVVLIVLVRVVVRNACVHVYMSVLFRQVQSQPRAHGACRQRFRRGSARSEQRGRHQRLHDAASVATAIISLCRVHHHAPAVLRSWFRTLGTAR
jgi:hypothetical protein